MKNLTKIVIVFFAFFMIISGCTNHKVYATRMENIIKSGDAFIEAGDDDAIRQLHLAEASENIFYIFLTVAIAIAVIVGAIIGIKIMTGTIEEKAKMKEMLVPYVVGVAVISMPFFIWSSIVKIGTATVGTGEQTAYFYPGYVIRDTSVYAEASFDSEVLSEMEAGTFIKGKLYNERFFYVVEKNTEGKTNMHRSGYVQKENLRFDI